MFHEAGVPIVICIKEIDEIDDIIAKEFSFSFYQQLLRHGRNQSVKNAYEQAK